MFIAELEKAIYQVADYAGSKDDLGYRVEVRGTLDSDSKILVVQSVRRLEPVALSCSRTRTK